MFFKNNTIKILCVSFLILSPLFSACQKSVIFKNVNSRANELVHYINASGDSLILKCKRPIYKIEIFNEHYKKEVKLADKNAEISLLDIPIGRFVILARLKDKLIAISLIRNESYISVDETTNEVRNIIAKQKRGSVIDKTKVAESKNKKNIVKKPPIQGYWIVKITKGQLGSKVTKRIANKNQAENYIRINKKEQKTKFGKFNILTVWELYDIQQFKKIIIRDSDYIKSESSDIFNVIPYYTSKIKTNNKLIVKY